MAVNPNNGSPITTPVNQDSGSTLARDVTNTVSTAGNIVVGGGGVLDTVATGVVGQAVRPVVDVATKAAQVTQLIQNPTLSGALSLLGRGFPPYRNELDQFASYNYIFTLGCLTNLELNFPLSYRTMGPLIKVIKSGGTGGQKIPTIYETDGVREFFIEDVHIKNHCAPNPGTRLSNAMAISFKVIEPYSMGQFLHNLRTAALVAGHSNYIEAPFLLSVAFKGYDDDGNVKAPLFSQRHFPIRIAKAAMKVTESGAEYHVEAVAYNDMASTDATQTTTQDLQIKGDTVGQVLQSGEDSLTRKVNHNLAELARTNNVPAADQYVIQFPQTGGLADSIGGTFASAVNAATVKVGNTLQQVYESITGDTSGEFDSAAVAEAQQNSQSAIPSSALGATLKTAADNAASWNRIGSSKIVESATEQGNFPFQEAGFVESEEQEGYFVRGNLTYDTENRVFQFAAGSKIQDIIEEVVLLSEYGREFATNQPDMFGRVEWVRIETQVYNGTNPLSAASTGQSPKIYVYRVVPYEVDISNIAAPASNVLATFTRQAKAIKSYSYIYTGQNTDIVDFDLQFNMAFYTGIQGSRGQRQQDSIFGSVAEWFQGDREPATSGPGQAAGTGIAQADGNSTVRNINATDRPANGGGAREGTLVSIARQLNDMLIHSDNDLIGLDLTIHGDPYFLADAGIGNFVGISNPLNSAITIDGSMNPIDGEVHIVLNFRTPIDYDQEDGFVKYPLGGFLPIAMFSGVYQVIVVENNFKDGVFTQTLKLNRKRNQDLTLESIAGAILSDLKGGRAVGEGTPANDIEPITNARTDT